MGHSKKPFNPYHKWLGIPPSEEPPDHYRLLGVARFEDDADVIDSAADRQMAHVKTYAAGPQAPATQRLLNELAAARVCLLNKSSKRTYDAELRRAEEAAEQANASAMRERAGDAMITSTSKSAAQPIARPLTRSELFVNTTARPTILTCLAAELAERRREDKKRMQYGLLWFCIASLLLAIAIVVFYKAVLLS